jgi:hypothetical protein
VDSPRDTLWAQAGNTSRFEFCSDKAIGNGQADSLVDRQHPRNFVEVLELSPRGDSRVVLTARSVGGARVVCERANPQVDRNSKVVVRIDRQFLHAAEFEGNFSITGRLEGQGTSRAIEVPGYSVIGQEAQVAPVGVAAASTIEGMLGELERHWPDIDTRLSALRSRADSAGQVRARRLIERGDSIRQLRSKESLLSARIDTAMRQLTTKTTATDSQTTSSSIGSLRDSVQVTHERVTALQRDLVGDSISQQLAARPAFVREALGVLRANRAVLLVLNEFAREENLPLIRAVARSRNRMPSVLRSLASSADTTWRLLLNARVTAETPDAELTRYDEMITELRAAMRDVTSSDIHSGGNRLDIRPILLGAVKDAEINLRSTGAQVGDVLVLVFTDSVGVPPSNRSVEIRMQVRDFGLIQRVSDAVLLMNLPGERGEARVIADAQSLALSTSKGSALELPVPTRGSPTAGVSFGWVFSPRRDDDYSPLPYPVRATSSWLEPGFGFNAAVASVPMKRIVIASGQPPTEEAVGNQVGYTLGASVSIFGGALVWSSGWTLNSARARRYTALGISFLSATEKARELFKGLNP